MCKELLFDPIGETDIDVVSPREFYDIFFRCGGYRLARLIILKAMTEPVRQSDGFDLYTITQLQSRDGNRQTIKRRQEQQLAGISDIYLLMDAIDDILDRLPDNLGKCFERYFGKGMKTKGTGNEYCKRAVERALKKVLDTIVGGEESEYDFECEGMPAAEKLLDCIQEAEKSEKLINAIDVMKLYRNGSMNIFFTESVIEFYEKAGFTNPSHITVADLTGKVRKEGDNLRVRAKIKGSPLFRYILNINGRFRGIYDEPEALLPADQYTVADRFSFRPVCRNYAGKYVPTKRGRYKGKDIVYTDRRPGCRYQLVRDGIIIKEAQTPYFTVTRKDAEYSIRTVVDVEDLEMKLFLCEEVRTTEKKTRLERKISGGETNFMVERLLEISGIMKALEEYLPEKYDEIIACEWCRNEARLSQLFREIAQMVEYSGLSLAKAG